MALLHRATLRPTKLELLTAWLPTRPWYRGPASAEVKRVTSYRFDDPAAEVGIETFLARAGDGPLLQVPLTYRGAPLDGAERWLIGTTDHSVLGRRWVYDGCGDPVYASVLAHTILTGAGQAEEFVETDAGLERREPTSTVRGSGASTAEVPPVTAVLQVDDANPTTIRTNSIGLSVLRVLDKPDQPATSAPTLTGTWSDQPTSVVLALAVLTGARD